jgi:tRNA A-37 threonylcarbamoyl transferase component Bud32
MVVDDSRNNHRYHSVKVDETMTLKYRTVHDDVFDDDELSLPRTISFNSSAAITIDTASCTSTNTSSSTVTSSSNATSRSIATTSTRSTVTASTRNSNKSKLSSIQRAKTISSCPVTGQLSNVLDEYIIFPTVLGNGQYGKVRDCIHRQSRKYYACKSIDKSKVGRLDHLQREIEVLSMVDHHGIIKLVDCYEDSEQVHIITKKYTGGELFDVIVQETTPTGCLDERRACCIIKSLLEAVDYLHDNDIVHRDIKPENILFETKHEDSGIKLIDFGLSRLHTQHEGLMCNPVGTAYYMSPELLKGKYNKACDVWSIGVVAYILLCGYPPFNGPTHDDIFDHIKRGEYKFPSQSWSDKSDDAIDFIISLLKSSPRRRLTTKQALMHPWIVGMGCNRSTRSSKTRQHQMAPRRRTRCDPPETRRVTK